MQAAKERSAQSLEKLAGRKILGMGMTTKHGVVLGLVMSVLTAVGLPARAGVSEGYVFSVFETSPAGPTAAPFIFTGTDGVQLLFNGSGVATAAADVVVAEVVDINSLVAYSSHAGTMNSGESVADMAARIGSELLRMDDVGQISEGSDAARNVDFGDNAVLVVSFGVAIMDLIIAEDAGLDPFKLEYSPTADFASPVLLFNGFNTASKSAIDARSDFGLNDDGTDTDQIFLFRLDEALEPGYLRITETDNYGDTKLEIDFIGAFQAGEGVVIPEPNGFVLATLGLVSAGLVLRRHRR